jgi:hypothetical protein
MTVDPVPRPPWLPDVDENLKLNLPPGFELELGVPRKPTASARLREFVDGIAIATRGKRIGILGPRGAGKTTLHTYLRDGELTHAYRPTLGAAPTHKVRRTLADANNPRRFARLLLKGGQDVGGDRLTNYEQWEAVVRDSHFLVYLFDTERLVAGDDEHRREVVGDCTVVGQSIRKHHGDSNTPRLVVVGTHCDRVAGYAASTDPAYLEFDRRVRALQAVGDVLHYLRAARRNALRPQLLLGALNDTVNADDLAIRMLDALQS